MVKKILILSVICLTLFIFLFLWFNNKSYAFSKELLSSLPGCKESQELFDSSDSFSESEFEKLQKLTEKCIESKLKYIKSSPKPSGVSIKYGFW